MVSGACAVSSLFLLLMYECHHGPHLSTPSDSEFFTSSHRHLHGKLRIEFLAWTFRRHIPTVADVKGTKNVTVFCFFFFFLDEFMVYVKAQSPIIWVNKSIVEVHIHIKMQMSFWFRMELCLRIFLYTYWAFWFIHWRNASSRLTTKFNWIICVCHLVVGCPPRVWRAVHVYIFPSIQGLPFSSFQCVLYSALLFSQYCSHSLPLFSVFSVLRSLN